MSLIKKLAGVVAEEYADELGALSKLVLTVKSIVKRFDDFEERFKGLEQRVSGLEAHATIQAIKISDVRGEAEENGRKKNTKTPLG